MSKIKSLEQLGLSKKEAIVYLAALEVGHGSILDIAKKASIPKSSTHDTLKVLVGKGLVHTYIKKDRKFFSALGPDVLKNKHAKQGEELEKLLPQLEATFNAREDKPTVRFFEKAEGFRQVVDEILSEAKDILTISSPEELFKRFPDFEEIFSKERAKRGIPIRALFLDTPFALERHKTDKKLLRISKLIKAPVPFSSVILVWNNKVATITVKQNISIVVTESSENVAIYRSIFEMLWQQVSDTNSS